MEDNEFDFVKESWSPFRRQDATEPISFNPPDNPFDDAEDEEDDEPLGTSAFRFRPRPFAFARPDLDEDEELKAVAARFKNPTRREDAVGRELIKRWQTTKDPATLEQIYGHYQPLIQQTYQQHSSRRLPGPAIRGRVYNALKYDLDRYDPSSPKTFHEFFRSRAARERVSRWAGENSNFGKVNWERASKLGKLQIHADQFELDTGEAVTAAELRRRTGMSERDIRLGMKELRSDLLGSKFLQQDWQINEDAQARAAMQRVKDSLPRREQDMMDDALGGQMTNSALARKYGISEPEASRFKGRVSSYFTREMDLIRQAGGI